MSFESQYTGAQIDAAIALAQTATQPGILAAVATSGAWADLTGRPVLATVATSGAYGDLTGRPALAPVATSGAWADITGRPTFATVATSGAYADLSGRPVLGTAAAAAATDFATAAQGALAATAVQPGSLAAVATSGAWGDLTGRPATFPPSAHSHVIGDVTGLQAALDARAPLSHNHAIADVTGLQAALNNKQDARAALATSPASDVTGITGASALTNIVSMSQSAYDALTPKSATTLYVIT